jgi:hypothetical protein
MHSCVDQRHLLDCWCPINVSVSDNEAVLATPKNSTIEGNEIGPQDIAVVICKQVAIPMLLLLAH